VGVLGRRLAWAYAVLALGSGLALVVAVLARVSLGIVLVLLVPVYGGIALALRSMAGEATRRLLLRRARAGVIAGAFATLAYDAVRFALVSLLPLHVRPFEAIPLFGYLIAGQGISFAAATSIGFAYHYANGVLFGMAYGVLLAERSAAFGVLWGMGLEVAMLALYPRWLHLGNVLAEFTAVSLAGHLAYGIVLGRIANRLARSPA
jgi:hypothetical protein